MDRLITVNKKKMDYSPGMTVHDALLKRGALKFNIMAVYVNGKIVRDREQFPNWVLEEGDELIVIDYMGGG